MLEIYNEQVRDLLVKNKPQQGGLKIRQNPQKGFYVEGLKVFIFMSTQHFSPLDISHRWIKIRPNSNFLC